MKAIFYEHKGGWLHKCAFAGLDNKNRPQWVTLDQGDESMTLHQLESELGMGPLAFNILRAGCEEARGVTIMNLLACVMKEYSDPEEMSRRMRQLRDMGGTWSRTPQNLRFVVGKFPKESKDYGKCYAMVYPNDERVEVLEMEKDDLGKLMKSIRAYIAAIENDAGINLQHKTLVASKEVAAEISKENKDVFTEIINK